jgi:hypothetical protein
LNTITYVIKAEIGDLGADVFKFNAQKTMYGGKNISVGDAIFIFASENEGGRGLVARGIVSSKEAIPRQPGITKQTPRVSISIIRTAVVKQHLGRKEVKPFSNWSDGRPETELNFKLYRQATNKIIDISDETTIFLLKYFS